MKQEISIRVYYEDTDAGGIVYYANYLKFAERGRTELLRSLGFENKSLNDRDGLLFVVRHLEADYAAPAYLDDELMVATDVVEIGNASFTMDQAILRGHKALVSLKVKLVCINRKGKPVRVPAELRAALGAE